MAPPPQREGPGDSLSLADEIKWEIPCRAAAPEQDGKALAASSSPSPPSSSSTSQSSTSLLSSYFLSVKSVVCNPQILYNALLVCGLLLSLTLFNIVMEYVTRMFKPLPETSVMLVISLSYGLTGFLAARIGREMRSEAPERVFFLVSLSYILGWFFSFRSLRFVSFPARVLGKMCKPVPVMAFDCLLGKFYPLRKYATTLSITLGASLFMLYSKEGGSQGKSTLNGMVMLLLSLCCDGATGAMENKFIPKYSIGPFELLQGINRYVFLFSLLAILLSSSLHELKHFVETAGLSLLLLCAAGSIGQVFIFIVICRLGALNAVIIGTARKVITVAASILLYGHFLTFFQFIGLCITFCALLVDVYCSTKRLRRKANPEQTRGKQNCGGVAPKQGVALPAQALQLEMPESEHVLEIKEGPEKERVGENVAKPKPLGSVKSEEKHPLLSKRESEEEEGEESSGLDVVIDLPQPESLGQVCSPRIKRLESSKEADG